MKEFMACKHYVVYVCGVVVVVGGNQLNNVGLMCVCIIFDTSSI